MGADAIFLKSAKIFSRFAATSPLDSSQQSGVSDSFLSQHHVIHPNEAPDLVKNISAFCLNELF